MNTEWKKIKLGDIAYFNANTYSTNEKWDCINYLDTGNITNNKIESIQKIDILKDKLPSRARRKVKYNSIIYSTVRPNQKHFGIIKETPQNFLVSTGFTVIDVDSNRANADFIFYYLTQEKIVNLLHAIAEQSVSAYPSIKSSDLEDLEINCPPLIEQNKIASLLTSLSRKIVINNQINNNLEEQARTLYYSMAKNTKEFDKLSNFVSIKHGYAFKGEYISFDNNNIVLVTPGNFKIGGGFQEGKCKYFTTSYPSDYILNSGDLIVTMTDLSKESDTLGYGALVPENKSRIYLHNQRIGLVQFINDKLSKDYVYWFLRSNDYHMSIVGSSSGTTVKHTSPSRILEQMIPIPLNDTEEIINELGNIDKLISKNDLENIKLSELRNTLLPKVMSGELDVSDVEI